MTRKKLIGMLYVIIAIVIVDQSALSQTFFLRDVIWSSSGDLLVLGHEDMVCLHETEDFEPILVIDDLETQISAIALDNERGQLITGHLDGMINFWDLADGTIVETANFYNLSIQDIEISPDGSLLSITTRDERRTELWERETLTVRTRLLEVMSCRFCNSNVFDMEFSLDNQYLTLRSGDFFHDDLDIRAVIWIWDLKSDTELVILEYPKNPSLSFPYDFTSIDFSADSKYIIASENRGGVLLWNIQSGEYLGRTIVVGADGYAIGRFSPTGDVLATGVAQLRVGNISLEETGLQISEPVINDEFRGLMRDMAFDADGERLATFTLGNKVKIWDVETGDQIADFSMCAEE